MCVCAHSYDLLYDTCICPHNSYSDRIYEPQVKICVCIYSSHFNSIIFWSYMNAACMFYKNINHLAIVKLRETKNRIDKQTYDNDMKIMVTKET